MWIENFIYTFSLVNLIIHETAAAEMEGFIVGGDNAQMSRYPHSAFLAISCQRSNSVANWGCGSSIINQKILLTAAHCFETCLPTPSTSIEVGVGSVNNKQGIKYKASEFIMHPNYDPNQMHCDIALVKLKNSLRFSHNVKKVVLMRAPPYYEPAYVAGWGLADETERIRSFLLKEARQKVLKPNVCGELLDYVPKATFCADDAYPGKKIGYAAEGDSGSALVVRGYIQIGIVSYKTPGLSKSVVVYTNVSKYFDWIKETTSDLYCD